MCVYLVQKNLLKVVVLLITMFGDSFKIIMFCFSDPKWFEDLKRGDSAKRLSAKSSKYDLDSLDSGMDLNDNYSPARYSANKKNESYPVSVVRPSSRSKENNPYTNDARSVSSGRRLANFCHDCGTKYPVTNAKFCCECGVQRMALA